MKNYCLRLYILESKFSSRLRKDYRYSTTAHINIPESMKAFRCSEAHVVNYGLSRT